MVPAPGVTLKESWSIAHSFRAREPAGSGTAPMFSADPCQFRLARTAACLAVHRRRARKLLRMNLVNEVRVAVGVFLSRSQIREVTMSIFSYRKHLRFLTHSQRRRWWDQRKRLTPRVKISGAYVPPNVTREFTYVKVG